MSKYREMTHEEVLAECKKYMNDEHLAFVESHMNLLRMLMKVSFRVSGQPYIIHPLKLREL
jgi:GTP pyrophosphokinase